MQYNEGAHPSTGATGRAASSELPATCTPDRPTTGLLAASASAASAAERHRYPYCIARLRGWRDLERDGPLGSFRLEDLARTSTTWDLERHLGASAMPPAAFSLARWRVSVRAFAGHGNRLKSSRVACA